MKQKENNYLNTKNTMNISTKIFNSFQEYIEAENMVFETLDVKIKSMTLGSKDIE
jgi:hypothetical protein